MAMRLHMTVTTTWSIWNNASAKSVSARESESKLQMQMWLARKSGRRRHVLYSTSISIGRLIEQHSLQFSAVAMLREEYQ
jgi:hypothetical protein